MLDSTPSRRELLAWALAVVLAVTVIVVSRPDDAGAGAAGPQTKTVFIATGENFPDALVAAAGGAFLAPVLLVTRDTIPQATLTELNRLEPEEIIIVGGTAVVSLAVEDQLEALDFSPTVIREAGLDRYATAADLSERIFPTTGLYPRASHAESFNLDEPVDGDEVVLTTTLTAPETGVLMVWAGADYLGGPQSDVDCWIEVNGVEIEGSDRDVELNGTDNSQENCQTESAVNVAAGVHTVEYWTDADADVTLADGALTVLWVPFDGDGRTPVLVGLDPTGS